MSKLPLMKRSSRVLAIASLALTGCWGGSSSCPHGDCGGGYSYGAGSGIATCVDWDSYDDDWHRRHCGDPYWVWCNAPDASPNAASDATSGNRGGSSEADAGATGSATSSGSNAGSDGGGSGGNTGSETGSGDGGVSQSIVDGGTTADAGVSTAAMDGGGEGAAPGDEATVAGGGDAAAGDSAISESSPACTGDVCICQRDDDCPTTEVCDHTTATCVAPPPTCSALTTEVGCTGRSDCSPQLRRGQLHVCEL